MACKNCDNFDWDRGECRALPPKPDRAGDGVWPKVHPEDWCASDTSKTRFDAPC